MAEKFQKPKIFTKAWFPYFWDYYKIHFFVVLFAILLIVVTVFEVINTVHYDATINLIATDILPDEQETGLIESAEIVIDDANGDGEKHALFSQLNFTPEAMQDGNQVMALENKLMTLFASEDEMLFLFDEMMLRDILSMNSTEGMFVPVSDWTEGNILEKNKYEYNGEVYALRLDDSKICQKLGIKGENLYVAVRQNYKPDDEELVVKHTNCKKIANAFVTE